MISPEAKAGKRFALDTAGHTMTVLHDEGLYRHLRFRGPRNEIAWYEIVTWPGALAVRGDFDGGYIFRRQQDMLDFFRRSRNTDGINPDYWAEKLAGGPESVRGYSPDLVEARLERAVSEYRKRYPEIVAKHEAGLATYDTLPEDAPIHPDDASYLVFTATEEGDLEHEQGALGLARELARCGVTTDLWPQGTTYWSQWYLWVCHAIVAGVDQYDLAKATAAPVVPA